MSSSVSFALFSVCPVAGGAPAEDDFVASLHERNGTTGAGVQLRTGPAVS